MLYRYINWDDKGSRRFITHNELYFYSAEKWKADGEYQFELSGFTEANVTGIITDIAVYMHNYNKEEYKLWMEVQAQHFAIDLNAYSQETLDLLDQHLAYLVAKEWVSNPDKFKEIQRQLYFARTGIFSLSQTQYSYNLWNLKRNLGSENIVCVGIDEDLLSNAIRQYKNCIMAPTTYSGVPREYVLRYDKNGFKSWFQLLGISFTLDSKFTGENEIRIQRLLLDTSVDSAERKMILPNEVFKEIIALKSADLQVVSELVNWVNQKSLPPIQFARISEDDASVSINS